mgnify:CR=1 FL=1
MSCTLKLNFWMILNDGSMWDFFMDVPFMDKVVDRGKCQSSDCVDFSNKYESIALAHVAWQKFPNCTTNKEHVLNTWNFVKQFWFLIMEFFLHTFWKFSIDWNKWSWSSKSNQDQTCHNLLGRFSNDQF